jgi:hypothetical protein
VKNYIVWTNCRIEQRGAQFGIAPAADPEVTAAYDEMFRTSVASAQANIRGSWTGIVFDEPCQSRVDMFKKNWQKIYDLWHSEPCNILYLDSDTIVVKPVEIFGRFPDFRLFNWTEPARNNQFANYFNAAVRYYPAHMTPETWAVGEKLAENWNLDIWDQEQLIFNEMLWSQPISWEDAHHPELNWQAATGKGLAELNTHSGFNTFPLGHARIIHYHGSRDHIRGQMLARGLAAAAGIAVSP